MESEFCPFSSQHLLRGRCVATEGSLRRILNTVVPQLAINKKTYEASRRSCWEPLRHSSFSVRTRFKELLSVFRIFQHFWVLNWPYNEYIREHVCFFGFCCLKDPWCRLRGVLWRDMYERVGREVTILLLWNQRDNALVYLVQGIMGPNFTVNHRHSEENFVDSWLTKVYFSLKLPLESNVSIQYIEPVSRSHRKSTCSNLIAVIWQRWTWDARNFLWLVQVRCRATRTNILAPCLSQDRLLMDAYVSGHWLVSSPCTV